MQKREKEIILIEDQKTLPAKQMERLSKAAKPGADTTLSAGERGIGGLGILLVKKDMDEVQYSYENGANILTIRKNL